MTVRSRSFLGALLLLALVGASACGGSGGDSSGAEVLPEFCSQPAGRYPMPAADRPRYRVELSIDRRRRLVTGHLQVSFTPDTATDRLVFRLWPNSPAEHGARLTVGKVSVNRAAGAARLADPTMLIVPLATPLEAGQAVVAELDFRLKAPAGKGERIAFDRGIVRLGSFLPILPWEPGRGWALEPPASIPSETSTSPVADWDVTIKPPRGATVLASGVEGQAGHWTATAVRDFALAAGHFELARETAHAPDAVAITVGVGAGRADPVQLAATVRADIERLAREYGPYPWPTFSAFVVPGLRGSGIEYPNAVYLGEDAAPVVVAHEVAHQWFYSLVGNDQARDPWLDEALASWAGGRVSGDLARFMSTPVPDAAGGHLGDPMTYWNRHGGMYFAGVYAQGAQALGGSGSEAGVRCALRRYVERNAYRIATPDDLLAALRAVYPDAGARFQQYGVG
jgi:peptidase M1-like protein